MTEFAISGPIPSPGKRVAVIGVVSDEKARAAAATNEEALGFAEPKI